MIQRLPKSHRYREPGSGWRSMLFCTRCYARLLRPGLARLEGPPFADLRRHFDEFDQAIDQWLDHHQTAA